MFKKYLFLTNKNMIKTAKKIFFNDCFKNTEALNLKKFIKLIFLSVYKMKLSVLIPAHNEQDCLETTVQYIYNKLKKEKILHEILVVDDNSTDDTYKILTSLTKEIPTLKIVRQTNGNGFGLAVQKGLENFKGDSVIIMMADESDSVENLVSYYYILKKGYDCAFGSRFHKESRIENYPPIKMFLNRLTNNFIRALFGIKYDDVTNAFKGYSRETINGLKPFLSKHFNMTVELPLKAIIRGYDYKIIPISWKGRDKGYSKMRIKEIGSRYLFIIMHCFFEKMLSRGYYRKNGFK